MSGAPHRESGTLADGAVTLLDSYRSAHGGAEVRLWARENDAWLLVFPCAGERSEAADGGPGAGAVPVVAAGGPALALEVRGGGAAARGATFLAAALAQVLRHEQEARLAARELAERYEEINLLYSISEILGSVLSLASAGARILTEVTDVLGARRASLWVHDPEQERLDLVAAVGEEGLSGPISVEDAESVTARVFRERQALSLERGALLPRGAHAEIRPHDREPFLSVPISYTPPEGKGRTVGVITLVGRREGTAFSAGDVRLLAAIASQVGAALEAQRLVAASLRQERFVRELELAHDLQLKLLPEPSQFAAMAQVAARCAPADSVGGDFYYLFPLSGERIGVLIGDVSSHGFSAALIMAMTISAAAIYAQEAGPPGELVRRVHQSLIDELETTEMFVSLFYGVLDPAAGTLVYANAGHPHAFRVTAGGEAVRLGATGTPLGTAAGVETGEASEAWEVGRDLLCLFTDGLSDAFVGGGREGEANLVSEVVRLRARPPAEIVERLFERAGRAQLSVPPDDRTAVLLRV